jgi:hypothetical protein
MPRHDLGRAGRPVSAPRHSNQLMGFRGAFAAAFFGRRPL